MTTESKRHIQDLPETVFRLLLQLMIEQGYLTEDGYLTPLGEQYLAAMDEASDASPESE